MSRERLELLKLLWPAGAVALAFGMVHCVLLCLLGEALEAGADIDLSLYWGGAESLFCLNSALLGWVTIRLLEHRLGTTGPILLVLGSGCWVVAVGSGVALAALLVARLPEPTWELGVLCIVSALGAATLRMYLYD